MAIGGAGSSLHDGRVANVRTAPWRTTRLALTWLERGLLGRGRPRVRAAVREAVGRTRDAHHCLRCGLGVQVTRPEAVRWQVGQGPTCVDCRSRPRFDAFVRLGRYQHPLDALIRRGKEQAWHAVLDELGWCLGHEVHRRLHAPSGGWLVVPVPSPWLRRLHRGVDHAATIAAGVARRLAAPLVCPLRHRSDGRQASRSRALRLQAHGRITARRGVATRLAGRAILLVDDVRTTGSTLLDAEAVLKGSGAAIVVPAVLATADTLVTQSPIAIDFVKHGGTQRSLDSMARRCGRLSTRTAARKHAY